MGTPSTAAVRAAAIADETYSRFARENCPGNAAAVHFAGLSQEDIARVIDRETGLPELLAAARLSGFVDAVLEVADTEGMADDTRLPVWPDGNRSGFPELTVGDLRALGAAIAKAGGRL
jgi:hypothetical protein